jgi:predicted DsbA family dithiol-disulfide isomerase
VADTPLRIDFVSDIACPWCAIGFSALERALERIGADIDVDIQVQPFELNPTLDAAGVGMKEYLQGKYGMSDEQLASGQTTISARGAAEGFTFGKREWIWNTFDAHRLLRFAGTEGAPGAQRALKGALFRVYHGEGRNPGAHDVLLELAAEVGLPVDRARQVLESNAYADEVRAAERFWQELGIHSVPAIVIDRKHLISGGQPSGVFEQALRQIDGARS